MGGMGSGGWNASGRPTVGSSATLSMSTLKRRGDLRPGSYSIWTWSRGGEAFASIGVHGECDGVRLSYSITRLRMALRDAWKSL